MSKIIKIIKIYDKCPCCSGYVDRTIYETGYRDNCDVCEFEGIGLSDENDYNPFDEPVEDILNLDTWNEL